MKALEALPERNPSPGGGGEHEGPLRRCIASGAVRPKDVLVRFVVGPDGTIVADVDERLPGRGFWLSADRDALKKACSRRLFAKAARAPVQVPADIVDQVEQALVRRCLSLIGLARRAGEAVSGFEKVRAWLSSKRAGLVLAASDGSSAGRAKLEALAIGLPIVTVLRSDELGAAAGRERAVYVVLARGKLAGRVKTEAGRLTGLRPALAADAEKEHV